MASNSKANGLNEAIPSQNGTHYCAEQVDTTEGCSKIDCFTFKDHDRVLHTGWSYGVRPKVEMRLFWIAYVLTLSDFL